MGKFSREKGARWERELAQLVRPVWPQAARSYHQCRAGEDGADLERTPGYWCEAKSGRKVDYRPALTQALAASRSWLQAHPGEPRPIPVVMARDDRAPPVAYLLLSDFLKIVAARDAPDVPGEYVPNFQI